MRKAHGRVGRVNTLTAFAGGAVNVDADFGVRDFDFDVLGDFRHDIDRAEQGVPALVRIEGTDAHETVNTALGFDVAVGVFAFDQHRRFGDTGLVPHLHV